MSKKNLILPSISYIVARSWPNNVIGCENKMPWNQKTDLKKFREYTSGHVVIMGRKTFESIGKPLPNRINVVLSRRKEADTDNVIWAPDPASALFYADTKTLQINKRQVFVIGGAEVFSMYKPFFTRIYLTEIFSDEIKGDTYFDYKFDRRQWDIESEDDYQRSEYDQYGFRISILRRKHETVRIVDVSDFMTEDQKQENWLDRQKMVEVIEGDNTGAQPKHVPEVPLLWDGLNEKVS